MTGFTGVQTSKSSSQLTPFESASSAQLPGDLPTAFSTANLQTAASAALTSGSKWHPRNLLTKSSRSLNHPSALSTPASSPTPSLPEFDQRAPFVLRHVGPKISRYPISPLPFPLGPPPCTWWSSGRHRDRRSEIEAGGSITAPALASPDWLIWQSVCLQAPSSVDWF